MEEEGKGKGKKGAKKLKQIRVGLVLVEKGTWWSGRAR